MRRNCMKKWLAALLCLALLAGMVPSALAVTPGKDGFVFAAGTAAQTIVKPTYIPAEGDQTLRQALEAAGYTLMLEGGFLYELNGIPGNYSIRDNDGAYDLDAPAAGKHSLLIEENTGLNQDADALAVYLAGFYSRTDKAANYPAVQTAETAALECLGSGSDFAGCLAALEAAAAEYEALMAGEKYTVTFTVTKGSEELTSPLITVTDLYGNITAGEGTSLSLTAGTYRFSVSDGGFSRTEGSLTVEGACSRSVALPDGDWFAGVSLLNSSKAKFASEDDPKNHRVTVHIPDTVGTTGIFLNAIAGSFPEGTRLHTVFIGADGSDKSTVARSWNSTTTSLSQLLTPGMTGRTFDLEASYADTNQDTEIQSYTVAIDRLPTLRSLQVLDNGANGLGSFVPESSSFAMDAISDSVTLDYVPFSEGYSVTVNGAESKEVALAEGENLIAVTVSDGTYTNTYQIKVNRVASVPVTLQVPAGTQVELTNAAGSPVLPAVGSTYQLIAGQIYTYTTTKAEWYHTSASFTAQANLTITPAQPDTADALTDFAMYQSASYRNRVAYEPDAPFTPASHRATYRVSDANSTVYVQATKAQNYTAQAIFTAHASSESMHGTLRTQTLANAVDPAKNATGLTYSLISGGYGREITIRLSRSEDTVTYYQDYSILIHRLSHMRSVTLTDENGEALLMYDSNGQVVTYDRDRMTCTVNVTDSAERMTLTGEFYGNGGETPVCGGYRALVNGEEADVTQGVTIALNPELAEETVTLQVLHADPENIPATYTFRIVKLKPIHLTAKTTPAETRVFITNNANGKTQANNGGVFSLTPGNSYTITATAVGYIGQQQTYTAPDKDSTLVIELQKAEENTSLTRLEAQWPYFRADENNNGIVSAPTPTSSDEAVLYWANRVGEGWDTGACGCPILVDDCLYVYADTRIVKVDSLTGRTLASGTMDRSSSFAINSPTYADGMVFVGLSNGGVQAFDAVTLESLWIYNDPLKGQPNCPIYYHDGYIYTGFWNGETLNANAVCLSVTDEDPSSPMEEKLATWTYTCKGGFYWSGSYVTDRFALIPTDDGASGYTTGYASLVSINPETGNVIDILRLPDKGDARTSVCYDEVSGKYWFATKGGFVYGASVNPDGTFNRNQLSRIALYNYANDSANPAMSTCTPTIYNGRMYIGVSGVAQFGAYSGHNITVIDLNREKIAYTVRTQGYPQTSGLVTAAYEEEDGSVYVYFFDNYTPGKLRVIKDKPGQTEPNEILVEEHVEKGSTVKYDTAPILFTPDGAQAQYAICSPIADQYGTIYFKNDSGYLMAVGSTIESLEITSPPDRTAYRPGDTFDPAGMTVTAVFTNGTKRDVTPYLSWNTDPLTEEDADFILTYDYVMYQDKDGRPGVEYTAPSQVLTLTINTASALVGDINKDGTVNLMDVSLLFRLYVGDVEQDLTMEQLDVNGDGSFTLMDVADLFRLSAQLQ